MRSAEARSGRRIVVVLEPGDDVLRSLAAACETHGIRTAVVPVFLGAFTSVTLIGTHDFVVDPDAPLPDTVEVDWVEGTGSATIAEDARGELQVHLHGSFGDKLDGSIGYTGHVVSATTHYTAEVVIDEVLGTSATRLPDAAAHGITTLHLA